MSGARTVVTGPMRAEAGPHTTALERRGTFPLTPTPSAAHAAEVARSVAASVTPAPPRGGAGELPKVRAVSASVDPRRALESLETDREHDYDKLVGQTLDGRYYIQKKIGEGGMGVVFAARHAVIERPLAIKVLKRQVMRDTATIRRFVQEAKAASRIGHPNIVDVTDFGTTPDGMTYSVMEYVSGQTLGAALRQSAPFSMPRAVRIAVQIARALGAAHDKGIVHRDLKPENVFLVDRDGRPDFVKIVDFGIAKVTPLPGQSSNEPRLTRAGSVFGTPEYMAPEQAAGRTDTDGRVDIYALGVILYEMVTGRVPFRGDSTVRTLAMQMLDTAEPPTKVRPDLDISPFLEGLILKALGKKREDRFQTMGELLAALDKLQVPVGTSVTGSPVYALVPLPPGADPALASESGPALAAASWPVPGTPGPLPATPVPAPVPVTPVPIPDASGPLDVPHQITGPGSSRPPAGEDAAAASGRRLKDEPEFVGRDKPITFEHVLAEEHAPRTRRAWPLLLLFGLILGGAFAVTLILARSRRPADDEGPLHVATPPAPDAAPIALVEVDAAAPPPDATAVVEIAPADAAVRVAVRPPDAGTAAAIVPVPRGRPVEIQVLTKPEGATLYVGTEYRGPGGAHLREPLGTTLEVICKHPGYKPGVVKLVFDGKREAELCVLERIVVCIPGVKNPFDECPD